MAGKSKSTASKSGSKGKSTLKTAMTARNNPAARARIPQTVGLPGQVANNAGGFAFPLPIEQEWMRYLIIGSKSDNGNYYQSGGQIATCIAKCIMAAVSDPTLFKQLLCDLVDVSVKGRAPKQEMTMMSLAASIVFAPNPECKALALDSVERVCRIPTHWFMLLQFIRDFSQDKSKPGKGMGKGVRRVFAKLYTSRAGLELAVLLNKYKNREGWTHRDIISLLHINPADMKDDGARLVLDWFMKEDKPARKAKDGTEVPATLARTEFLTRLNAIHTPPHAPSTATSTTTSTSIASTISSAISSVFTSAFASTKATTHAAAAEVVASSIASVEAASADQQQQQQVCVHFNIISGPMAGEDKLSLKIGPHEPLTNLLQTFTEIGAGDVELRFNTTVITSEDTIAKLILQGFDLTKRKIYARAITKKQQEQAQEAAAAKAAVPAKASSGPGPATHPVSNPSAPVPTEEMLESERRPKWEKEDPLVATARFLKALVELSKTGATKDTTTALRVMRDVRRIQREHLPTELLSCPAIWSSLLDDMGMTALVRNLGKLSSTGVASTKGDVIIRMLTDQKRITESRLHPFAILVALKTYSTGKSDLGSSTWPVNPSIMTALSTTFRMAFGNVERTGKRIMIALDVSGSMSGANCAGSTVVNCREGSVAMAMATLHAEGDTNTHIYAFTTTFKNMSGRIRPGMTIHEAMKATDDVFGGTDCALPMTEAIKWNMKIDAFIVYTDSETYGPTIHPQVALEQYRKHSGIDAKLIVVGMAANSLSIADPKDPNTLNLAGFDTSTPNIISMFINGEL